VGTVVGVRRDDLRRDTSAAIATFSGAWSATGWAAGRSSRRPTGPTDGALRFIGVSAAAEAVFRRADLLLNIDGFNLYGGCR
jgi:hypothetical protein